MIPPSKPRYSTSFETSDFDEFSEVTRGWDLDFRPLRAGDARVLQLGGPDMQSLRAEIGTAVHQRGRAPAGFRTFAVFGNGLPLRWCGREIDGDHLVLKHPDGTFEAASDPGFLVYTLSYSETRLSELAEQAGLVPELPADEAAIRVEPSLLGRLRTLLRRIHESTEDLPQSWDWLEDEVPKLLLSVLHTGPAVHPGTGRARDEALRLSLEYLEAHPHESTRVRDLCRVTGASERTLRYAFREHFGVSPKAYIHSVRLTRVKRELRLSDPATTRVSDVANRFAFWHMGQFAADYRRFCGELPSETLARPATGT